MDDKEMWGALPASALDRIVVVSPHFDDAALGAAHLLTTYPDEVTSWDAAGGFVSGDDVVGVRQEEDRAAVASMGATPVWLDFPDHQYLSADQRPTASEVAPSLQRAIVGASPTSVFLPMGLANPDHVLTHDAGLLARASMEEGGSDLVWFCYEDAGYKHLPGLLAWRVSKLFRSGLWPTPAVVPVVPDMTAKRVAVELYASQVGPLERDHLLSERLRANIPEQYWRLAAPPPGWERLASSDVLDARQSD